LVKARSALGAVMLAASLAGIGIVAAPASDAALSVDCTLIQCTPPEFSQGAIQAFFPVGVLGKAVFFAQGQPTPTLTETGPLPAGIAFVTAPGAAEFKGVAQGPAGKYPITITASNGVAPDAQLTVDLVVGCVLSNAKNGTCTLPPGTTSITVQAEGGAGGDSSSSGVLGHLAGIGSDGSVDTAVYSVGGPTDVVQPGDTIQVYAFSGGSGGGGDGTAGSGGGNPGAPGGDGIGIADVTQGAWLAFGGGGGGGGGPAIDGNGGNAPALSAAARCQTADLPAIPPAGTSGVGHDGRTAQTATLDGGGGGGGGGCIGGTGGRAGIVGGILIPFSNPDEFETAGGAGGESGLGGLANPPSGILSNTLSYSPSGIPSYYVWPSVGTVDSSPAIVTDTQTTFRTGDQGSFTVATTGTPTPSLKENGELPAGVSFTDNGNGTGTLQGTPSVPGSYPITITASNGVSPDDTQNFTLTVDAAPTFAVANPTSATFVTGSPGSVTVTASGSPTPTLSQAGSLPAGVTFTDNGDGTGTLSGTPSAGTGGKYPIEIIAANSVSQALQTFTLTVNQPPGFTNGSATTFVAGQPGSFSVTTSGYPTVATLSESGALPSGVSFTDNGDGTGTLSGTPAPSSGGTYPITIKASNGVTPDALQNFTLTVNQSVAITSPANATFITGSSASFTVTTSGFPTPTLTEAGSLPTGVTFTDNGDGTATLGGTPLAWTGGKYPFEIIAANSVSQAVQNFTLTVNQAPAITSNPQKSFIVGQAGSFTVATAGYPTAALTESGALPNGVTFTDNGDGTATLSGTPTANTSGVYQITLTASNGVTPDYSQKFTLTIDQVPLITSASSAIFTAGKIGSFTVSASGFPAPSFTEQGTLPGGVTLIDHNNGTASLSGTPVAGSGGIYTFTITADNGISSPATQTFVLTVNEAPAFTSPSSATVIAKTAFKVIVTTRGFPVPSLIETGKLPKGVTFVNNGNGTATLSGTSTLTGTYSLVFTASNSVGTAKQTFTLKINVH